MAFLINGKEIDDMVLEEEFDGIKEHHERLGEVVCCDRDDEFREQAKINVINRTLLHAESLKKLGEAPKEEIDEAIEQLKEDHGGEEAFFANIGMSPDQMDDIRDKVGTTISVDNLLRQEVGEDPEVTDEALKQFYEDNIENFMTEEEVQAWHVYVEPNGAEEADEMYALMRKLREELLDGADFEKVCKEHCRDDHQMDLGSYKRGGLMQEIELITFSMRVGEISPVIGTHFGYHIFLLKDRREPKPVPFEELKEKLAEEFVLSYREDKVNGLIERLKSEATIEELEPAEI